MNRVIVVGSQGSGKTTLAKYLCGSAFAFSSPDQEVEVNLNDEAGERDGRGYRPMTEGEGEEGGGVVSFPLDIALVNSVGFVGADSPYGLETGDHQKWTQIFMTSCIGNPSIPYDAGAMDGWFANAMGRGEQRGRELGIKWALGIEEPDPKASDIGFGSRNHPDRKFEYTSESYTMAEPPALPYNELENRVLHAGYPEMAKRMNDKRAEPQPFQEIAAAIHPVDVG